ncbi:MAG: phage tail protein [Herbaspirillum sp.]
MAQFTVDAQRFDPYKNFEFRVKWDGRYVAGVSRVSGLNRSTDVTYHSEGGDPLATHKSPGVTQSRSITLERAISHDTEFEAWANQVWDFGAERGTKVSSKDFRKDVTLEIYTAAGQLVLAYTIHRCWVSEYQAIPYLDAADTNVVMIEQLTLENEGWARDIQASEPGSTVPTD